MKLSKKKLEAFTRSQLMTLIALELVDKNVTLSPEGKTAIADARSVTSAAVDKILADYPKMRSQVEAMSYKLSAAPVEELNVKKSV
jgi:hypothetical protein